MSNGPGPDAKLAGADGPGGRPPPSRRRPLLSCRQTGALLIQVAFASFIIWAEPFESGRISARYSELLAGAVVGDRLLPDTAAGADRPARDRIAVVLLDEMALRCEGHTWPPPYSLHANILNGIKAHRPQAIFMDFTFDVPRDRLRWGPHDETFSRLIEALRDDPPPGGYFMAAGAQSCGDMMALKEPDRLRYSAGDYCPLITGVHEELVAAGVKAVQARQGSSYDELGNYPLRLALEAVPRDLSLREHVLEGRWGQRGGAAPKGRMTRPPSNA